MKSEKQVTTNAKNSISQFEFITLMACLMSIVALSIDAILPALQPIGLSLGIVNPNDNQLLITMIFLGLGFGQLIFGPISDSFGRKPTIYIGFLIFVLASFVCIYATNIEKYRPDQFTKDDAYWVDKQNE